MSKEFRRISGIVFLCIILNILIVPNHTVNEKLYQNFEGNLKPKNQIIPSHCKQF